jgi:hypothetical protein
MISHSDFAILGSNYCLDIASAFVELRLKYHVISKGFLIKVTMYLRDNSCKYRLASVYKLFVPREGCKELF